jgi:hypothetical protein
MEHQPYVVPSTKLNLVQTSVFSGQTAVIFDGWDHDGVAASASDEGDVCRNRGADEETATRDKASAALSLCDAATCSESRFETILSCGTEFR